MTYSYSYLSPQELAWQSGQGRVVVIRFHDQVRCVRRGTKIMKRAFVAKAEEESFLHEFWALTGKGYPSSYADVWHRLYRAPWVPVSVARRVRLRPVGGWEEARRRGFCPGTWYVYDLRSAYAWAASRGLPDVQTAEPSRWIEPDGLYIATIKVRAKMVPPEFRTDRPVLISTEEIETYDATVRELHAGLHFRRRVDVRPQIDTIRSGLTRWKDVLRGFWGVWLSRAKIQNVVMEDGVERKVWSPGRPMANLPWAHAILSRVKMRVAEHREAAHVFVDSVIVPDPIRTGDDLGDWRLVETVRDPMIGAPGRWGTREGWRKQAGVKRLVSEAAVG